MLGIPSLPWETSVGKGLRARPRVCYSGVRVDWVPFVFKACQTHVKACLPVHLQDPIFFHFRTLHDATWNML